MAGLISTGIAGFIASAKFTGKQILNKAGKLVPEVVEDFLSGFAGHGWKIWKTVAGFFRLEIDELVVRRTMTVFELLIQKIRAVKGAMAITQANGKIKTVTLLEDESLYLITLEEDDMSFVDHDFIRCQEFSGGQRFYHVEVASVSEGVIRIPASEFEGSSEPMPGDEIVQFGNSSHDAAYAGRHSAIYLHADESGQPAIDVMFDIYSKNWAGCVKARFGGDIPGTDGLKGFYCENGMIKGVDSTGHTTYCIYPDGSAMFGDGSAKFNADKSGHIAGGAIAWEWSEAKQKFVCTMGDVLLKWDNLSDEVKDGLKGDKGDKGDSSEGVPGKPGADGKVLYTWLRYADTSDGSGISNNPTGKLYIGFAYNKETAVESNTASDYKWSLIKGTDGVPGEPGEDGKTTYTWIAYADNADGSGMYQIPKDSTKYIGIAVNKDTATKGSDPAEYTWSLFKGTDGKPGTDANLFPWVQEYEDNKTLIGGEYVISPKMFSGTSRIDENGKQWLTGIAMGRDCITDPDGTKRTGIFAVVDNEVIFELDPMTKKYVFRGRVEADEGIFKGKVEIAGGKIQLNDDGSGQLSSGALFWDADGIPYSRHRFRIAWRSILQEMNDAGILNGADYNVDFSKGTYLNVHSDIDEKRIINLPDPSYHTDDELDFFASFLGRAAGTFIIKCSTGVIRLYNKSTGEYTDATTIVLEGIRSRNNKGSIYAEWNGTDEKHVWIATGDFVKYPIND